MRERRTRYRRISRDFLPDPDNREHRFKAPTEAFLPFKELRGRARKFDPIAIGNALNECLDNTLECPDLSRHKFLQVISDSDILPSGIRDIKVFNFPTYSCNYPYEMMWAVAEGDDGFYARSETGVTFSSDRRPSAVRDLIERMYNSSVGSLN